MKKIVSIILALVLSVSLVSIDGIIPVLADETQSAAVIDLISAYGNKDLSIVYSTTVNGDTNNTVSQVTAESLTAIAEGTEGVPADNAYFVDINETTAKSGMMFKLDADISPVFSNYLKGELYLDMWVWVADPTYFKVGNVRFLENRILSGSSYVEFQTWDSPDWLLPSGTKGVVAGWNHITVQVNGSGTDNNATKRRERAQLYTDSTIEYVAIYNHAARPCDYAVACARLITLEDAKDDSWDITVEGKKVYHVGETLIKSDYVVKNKGQVVTDYTVSSLDTSKAVGDTQILFTVGDKSVAYPVRVKSAGFSAYDESGDTMKTMSSGASINNDDYIVGNSSVELYNKTSSEISVDTAVLLTETEDFLGEEYIETWIYANQTAVEDDNLEFLIELSSNGDFKYNCYRFRWNNAVDYYKFSSTVKEGWNLVKIPLRSLHYNEGSVYTDTNVCQIVYDHDSNTLHSIDWTKINYIRARAVNLNAGGLIRVNGIGFGIGTAINGESAGNDIANTLSVAQNGDVVKLQRDYVLTESIVIDKNITLDLNGFSLSGADTVISSDVVITDSNSYLKNENDKNEEYIGRVDSNILISEGASLTIANGIYSKELSGATISGGIFYNTLTNCAINGGKIYGKVDRSCEIDYGYFFDNDSYEAVLSDFENYDADDVSIKYLGNWTTLNNLKNAGNKTLARASKRGSTAEFEFIGSAFSINGYLSNTYGKIAITVDNSEEFIVDLYNESPIYKKHIFGAKLSQGNHKVKIKILDTKNPLSKYEGLFYAAIDSIDVVGELVDISESSEYVVINSNLTKNKVKFKIENAFVNGGESSPLVAYAQYGKVETGDGYIVYYAGAPVDTITYSLNNVKGKINVRYSGHIQAEYALDKFIEGEYKTGKYGISVFNSGLFDENAAVVLEKGNTVEFAFEGNSIEVIGYKSASYSNFELYIDGSYVETVDESLLTAHNLYKNSLGTYLTDDGMHTVKIVALGKCIFDSFKVNTADRDNKIKVGTFDITNGSNVGYDYKIIADDIVKAGLDVVALQSVDRFADRSQNLDSVKIISQLSGFKYYTFVKAVDLKGNSAEYTNGGAYGIAVLSKYPIKATDNWKLTSSNLEQRVLVRALIDFNGIDVNVFNTQLSVENASVRETQFDEIDAIVSGYSNVILAGNFGNSSFNELYQTITLSPVFEAQNFADTVVDTSVAFRCQDNISYSSDFSVVSQGVSDEIHSKHYMSFAELEYSPVTQTALDQSDVPSSTAVSQTVVYKSIGTQQLSMAIYQPTNKIYEEAPLLVLYPGGGWAYCYINGYAAYTSEVNYARANGWAVAVCEYRLCNRGQNTGACAHLLADCGLYGMVSDTMDAVRYLVKHSKMLGFDPTRIVTGGHSAGGYMSLITGLGDLDNFKMDSGLTKYNFHINSVTAKAGPTDFSVNEGAIKDYRTLMSLNGYSREQFEQCSPYYCISENMAPTLICYGTNDEIFDENTQWIPFAQKAKEVGATQVKLTEEAIDHSLTGSVLTYPAMVEVIDAVTVGAK